MIITTDKFKNKKSESSPCKSTLLQFLSIPSLRRAVTSPHFGNGDLCAMSIPVTQIDRFLTSRNMEAQWSISYWRGSMRTGPGCQRFPEKCLGDKRWHQMQQHVVSIFGTLRMSHPLDPTPIKQLALCT